MKSNRLFCLIVLVWLLCLAGAQAQQAKADLEKSIADLEKTIAQYEAKPTLPVDASYRYSELGRLYLEAKQPDKAISAYIKAAKAQLQAGQEPSYLFMGAYQIIMDRTVDPVKAMELLSKMPTNDPKTVRTIVERIQELANSIYYQSQNAKLEQLTKMVDMAEEILLPITLSQDQALADEAEYRLINIKLILSNAEVRSGKVSWPDVQLARRQALESFIEEHEESPVLYLARYDLGEMLTWLDPPASIDYFRAVIADANAPESTKIRSKSYWANMLIRMEKITEAEPILNELAALTPKDANDWTTTRAVGSANLELGKIYKKRGETAKAAELFKKSLASTPEWDRQVRDEAERLLALGEASIGMKIRPERRKVYEVEEGRMQISPGSSCRVCDSVALFFEPNSADGQGIPFEVSFTSPTPIRPSDPAEGIKLEQTQDAAGYHIKYTGATARMWLGYEEVVVEAKGAALRASFPEKDISMSAVSTPVAGGAFKIVVTINAPAGALFTASGIPLEMEALTSVESPPGGYEYGMRGVSFPPIAATGEVRYAFNVKLSDGSKVYLPRLVLTIPKAVAPAADEAKPSTEATAEPKAEPKIEIKKEVSGKAGDVSYRISTDEAFLPDEQPMGEALILIIPGIRH